MNRLFLNILWILALTACADGITGGLTGGEADDDTDVIHVGGLTGDELTIEVDNSRAVTATDAELVPWLINPLFEGFHIAYYRGNNAAEKRHAQLKLLRDGDTYKQSESGLAEYSFMETSSGVLTGKKAKWAGNGAHRFEGHYVPEQIRNEVPDAGAPNNLDNDQSDDSDTGNYTLLKHYLSMPSNHDINATIGRVKLPFYHRLCRVNAFVLINPDMGSDVKLEGYDISVGGKDDPTTTTLRFENVKVLRHVERTVEDGNEMFTPHWETVRRVIPHSEGEYGSVDANGNELHPDFILFESVEDGTPHFPNDIMWKSLKDAFDAAMNKYYADNGINAETATNAEKQAAKAYAEGVTKYRMTNYGKVPVYNIIVRPTYTSAENVMYDEPAGITHEEKNSITFVLRLNNGLEYEKMFTFDLDANRQTAVYLRINREAVDYNTSGSEVWDKNDFSDGYYGVNNENGNSLSIAGSSWQRAYRNSRGSGPADITDGSDYNENDEADHTAGGDDGQYISDANWIKCLLQASKDGKHHGDYFILDRDITISATLIPVDFVFTGHLDARGHTITLTDCGTTVTDEADWWEDNYQLAGDYSGGTYYVSDGAGNFSEFTMPDNIYKKTKEAVTRPATEEDVAGGIAENVGDEIVVTPAEYEWITTIAAMMSYVGQLYEKTANDTYVEYTKPTLYVNDVIHHPAVTHTSPSHLFAGLNGIYTTAQESNPALPAEQWEANVHKEGSYWVPVGGYRAEVLNTTVAGATLFKNGYTTGSTDAADVSGNVQNCRDSSGKVPNYSNGIPKY